LATRREIEREEKFDRFLVAQIVPMIFVSMLCRF